MGNKSVDTSNMEEGESIAVFELPPLDDLIKGFDERVAGIAISARPLDVGNDPFYQKGRDGRESVENLSAKAVEDAVGRIVKDAQIQKGTNYMDILYRLLSQDTYLKEVIKQYERGNWRDLALKWKKKREMLEFISGCQIQHKKTLQQGFSKEYLKLLACIKSLHEKLPD